MKVKVTPHHPPEPRPVETPSRAYFLDDPNTHDWDKISRKLSFGFIALFESIIAIIWFGWGYESWLIKAAFISIALAIGLGFSIGTISNIWFTIVSRIPKREVNQVETIKIVPLNDAKSLIATASVLNAKHFIHGDKVNRREAGISSKQFADYHKLMQVLGVRGERVFNSDLEITCPLLIEISEVDDPPNELVNRMWDFVEASYRLSMVSEKDDRSLWVPVGNNRKLFLLDK